MTNRSPAATRPTRRTFLVAGGAAVIVGAGGGIASGFRWRKPKPPAPPKELVSLAAAIATEQRLIWLIDNVTDATPAQRAALAYIRADHVEHSRVLTSLIPAGAQVVAVPGPAEVAGPVPALLVQEKDWSGSAASAALTFPGQGAVLLASISACEAGHVELLS